MSADATHVHVTPRIVPSYNHAMSQTETCKAAWGGGRCDRPAGAARGLCQGHYAQWRRQTDAGKRDVKVTYSALRETSGMGPSTEPVTVHLPRDTAEAYREAARSSGKSFSEFLRGWLETGYKRHQGREERRSSGPPMSR